MTSANDVSRFIVCAPDSFEKRKTLCAMVEV